MIGIVALVIVGPERLPGFARTVGLWVGKGRRMIADVKRDIDREIRAADMKDLSSVKTELEKVKSHVDSKAKDFVDESGIEDTGASLKQAMEEASPLKDEIKQDIDGLDQVAKEVEQELGRAEATATATATDKSLNSGKKESGEKEKRQESLQQEDNEDNKESQIKKNHIKEKNIDEIPTDVAHDSESTGATSTVGGESTPDPDNVGDTTAKPAANNA